MGGERQRSLDFQRQSAADELARLEEESGYQVELVESSDQEIKRLESELVEARKQSDQARQVLSEREQERRGFENHIQESRQKLISLTSRQGQLEVRVLERKEQIEREQMSLESAERLVRQHGAEMQAARERLAGNETILNEADQQVKAAERALHELQRQVDQIESQRRETAGQEASASTELARLSAQRRVFEQAEAALSGYGEGSARLLQAIRNQSLSGKSGSLSQYLDVPPALETAIGAVLGEFVEAVLVKEEPDQVLVDGGLDATAPWPKVHHDTRNTGNAATPLP